MATSQDHIDDQTPMGANLVRGGCTFRTWAPRATAVHVGGAFTGWQTSPSSLLVPRGGGHWAGFVPDVGDGTEYKFFIEGQGSRGWKRDPHARELSPQPDYPHSNCVIRDAAVYPWHDQGYRPPAFSDLVIYQFHVGRFYAVDSQGADRRVGRVATFLDVLDRIEYLAELGVNALEPLPVVEFPSDVSLGYNGVDYYSPEMAYTVPPGQLQPYVDKVNALLTARGRGAPAVTAAHLGSGPGQLKALIDVCHAWGMAVLLDVVYNHAGGDFGGGPTESEALYFFDRAVFHSNDDSLYFTDQGWAGGLVFAFWNRDVRQFLIDNAVFWLNEAHADGFRYDEVTVIDNFGGWDFCKDLTDTVRSVRPAAPQIAEFWKDDKSSVIRPRGAGGAGFDMVWDDRLRQAVRGALAQAAGGRDARIDLDPVRDALYQPPGFAGAWRSVNHLENHDLVYANHDSKQPRIAALADSTNTRSWYARSRSRLATGLLLTAPGVPMLFMGEELLEDKYWSDDPNDRDHLIWWDGLRQDKVMIDFLRFTRELLALRRDQPALRGDPINVFHVHNGNRVLAFHRWLAGGGRDVVVVASLNESTWWDYRLGFPLAGRWREVLNSDVYDNWVNPNVAGNGTGVTAQGPREHGLPAAANIVIPANGVLVFAKE